MTETLSCDVEPSSTTQAKETAFERPRGVSRIEVRRGFAQTHVNDLRHPVTDERVRVMKVVAAAGISLDFLKFTPEGLSFLVPEAQSQKLEEALSGSGVTYSIQTGRSIVLVFAVNMRDEEGLLATIVQEAIASGARVDHVGDGHDHLLLVVASEEAAKVEEHLRRTVVGRVS